MVTTTPPTIVRVPHPVQAGPITAMIWIVHRAIDPAILLVSLWGIAETLAWHETAPMLSYAWGAATIAALIAAMLLQNLFSRIERMRIPGAMRTLTMHEVRRTAQIPELVAIGIELVVIAAVLPHILTRSDRYGIVVTVLVILGGTLTARGIRDVAREAWNRLPEWRRHLAYGLVRTSLLAALLTYAGLTAGAHPIWYWGAASIALIVSFLVAMLKPTVRDLRGGLDETADALTARLNAAPTLRHRHGMRNDVRFVAVAAGILALGTLIVSSLV